MSDLISRRAAISLPVKPKEDRYFQTQNLDDAYDYGWYDLQECIEKLPPAQPDLQPTCNKLATDTIIRQEAIDALDGEIEITGRTNAEAVKGYVRLVKDRLERLPSAQTDLSSYSDKLWRNAYERGRKDAVEEIIHCRDCKNWEKTWTDDFPQNYHYCSNVDGIRDDNFYCADAERREE